VGLWSKYLVGKEVFGHAVSWVGDTSVPEVFVHLA
jgi:hypothetical protein